jgi:hypothetical protein
VVAGRARPIQRVLAFAAIEADQAAVRARTPEHAVLVDVSAANADELSQEHAELDPQQAWLALNKNIGDFLEAVPETQKLRVCTEDVLRDPDAVLASITEWLAISSDAEAIDLEKACKKR